MLILEYCTGVQHKYHTQESTFYEVYGTVSLYMFFYNGKIVLEYSEYDNRVYLYGVVHCTVLQYAVLVSRGTIVLSTRQYKYYVCQAYYRV
jgi:hypothetical protein